MKDYLSEIIDLTGDPYLNPIPAVYDNGTHIRKENQITSISVHHDAEIRPHDYNSYDRLHAEAGTHYERLGPGLQYHYVIDNVGQIFKIRPHTTWLYVVGSAENVSTLAIKLDGYLHPPYNQKPTLEQCEALFQLLKFLCTKQPQFPATWPDVRPHRDFSSTACPGDNLAPYVFQIKDEATALKFAPNDGYDWPSYQTPAPVPPAPPVAVPTPPTPPVVAPPPPVTPAPTPSVPDRSHDYAVENNTLLKQILALLQSIWDKITSVYK